MKRKLNIFMATTVVLTSMALSVIGGARAEAADKKTLIASVDVGRIFEQYEKTKKFDVEFQAAGRLRQEERDKVVYEIRRLRDEQMLLSEEARERKQGEIDKKMAELDEFDQKSQVELKQRRNDAVKQIFEDIETAIQQFGERKGIAVILNERAILYKQDGIDMTDEILSEINEQYAKQN